MNLRYRETVSGLVLGSCSIFSFIKSRKERERFIPPPLQGVVFPPWPWKTSPPSLWERWGLINRGGKSPFRSSSCSVLWVLLVVLLLLLLVGGDVLSDYVC